ncbi:MAG TPA: hypothetical protein VHO06_16700 [Polyangia bacterium]|nr:hypothetical protein [Polyangia bacterium]
MRSPRGAIPSRSRRAASGRALVLALGAAGLAACVPTAQTSPDAGPLSPLPCYGQACIPNNTVGAAVTSGATIDCQAAEDGLDFFTPAPVLDNEPVNGGAPQARYFYQYVDGTAGIWPSGYQPPSVQQDVCTTDHGNNHVLHESGGPFSGWGGGIGIGLEHLNQDSGLCTGGNAAIVCPPSNNSPTSTSPSTAACYCPNANDYPMNPALSSAIAGASLDLSQWDGISFYARRGPNSQPLMRVLVGDKYTDDDISFLTYSGNTTAARLCERKGECSCLYQDTTCAWYDASNPEVTPDTLLPGTLANGAYYCGAPGSHPGPASASFFSSGSTTAAANFCGRSLCDQPYPAYAQFGPDLEWAGRACTPYTYRNGTQDAVCYNPTAHMDANGNVVPADPLPAESDEQCGDHFTFPVHLSTDWQFYVVPFSQMIQQGWAKQAPFFDLTSLSVVRFTWDVGYVDYYIDNVRFYRAHRSPDASVP